MKCPILVVCSILCWLATSSEHGIAQEQQVGNVSGLVSFIGEALKANRSCLRQGTVRANLHGRSYADDGKTLTNEVSTSVTLVYRADGRIRCEYGDAGTLTKAILTDEFFCSHMRGDPNAYVNEPKSGETLFTYLRLLPDRCQTFGDFAFDNPNEILSAKAFGAASLGPEAYRFDFVLKKYPKDLHKHYVDLDKGCMILKGETLHDFANGYVLLRRDESEVQPTGNGAWCLKRHVQTHYRPDGSLRQKIEFDVIDFDFKSEIPEKTFTIEGMELPAGTTIIDRRMGDIYYTYGSPSAEESVIKDVLKQPLVAKTIAEAIPPQPTVRAQPPPTRHEEEQSGEQDQAGTRQTSSRTWFCAFVACGIGGVVLAAILVGTLARARKRKFGS